MAKKLASAEEKKETIEKFKELRKTLSAAAASKQLKISPMTIKNWMNPTQAVKTVRVQAKKNQKTDPKPSGATIPAFTGVIPGFGQKLVCVIGEASALKHFLSI